MSFFTSPIYIPFVPPYIYSIVPWSEDEQQDGPLEEWIVDYVVYDGPEQLPPRLQPRTLETRAAAENRTRSVYKYFEVILW